jgi:hypothetical protein
MDLGPEQAVGEATALAKEVEEEEVGRLLPFFLSSCSPILAISSLRKWAALAA